MKNRFSTDKQLRFGTSGLRDQVIHMTDLECYINARGFMAFLMERGELVTGGKVAVGGDRRESTPRIMSAVGRAIEDSGCGVICCGLVPSPTLAYYAMEHEIPSIMVTGSHIPEDRNGIKFTKRSGEVLKSDESDILRNVFLIRDEICGQSEEKSLFDQSGRFKVTPKHLPPTHEEEAVNLYIQRYLSVFGGDALEGIKLLFYQHSAVGRDIILSIFERLGAEIIPINRSDEFIPVDTEKIDRETRSFLKNIAHKHKPFAIISTDGDSDRPLLADEEGTFLPGDKLGALASLYLKPDGVALPVSSNDGVISMLRDNKVIVRLTRIGSPYVIKAMTDLLAEKPRRGVNGWEVNGGFLMASPWEINGNTLKALPTRDAVLPLLAVLLLALREDLSLSELIEQRLHARYTHADIIDNTAPGCESYTTELGRMIVKLFTPSDNNIIQSEFSKNSLTIHCQDGTVREATSEETVELNGIRDRIREYFNRGNGFEEIIALNFLDGIKISFSGGDISHLRPSGNAPEFRNYATGCTAKRAVEIVKEGKIILPRIIANLKNQSPQH